MNEELINKTKEKYNNFFGIEINEINLTVVNSREEIDKLKGFETKSRFVGWIGKHDNLFVLSEDKLESESNHKKEEYEKILKHEIAHLYIHKLTKCRVPVWLHEGLAMYLAGQVNPNITKEESMKALEFFNDNSKEVYLYAGAYVYFLIKEHGKDKIIDLLKKIPSEISKEDFQDIYSDAYNS